MVVQSTPNALARVRFLHRPHMIDHISLTPIDFSASKNFFEKTLAPLGIKPLAQEDNHYVGFGKERPLFWLGKADETHPVSRGSHIAFIAKSKLEVETFYEAALAAGAKDNGKPGYNPEVRRWLLRCLYCRSRRKQYRIRIL